MTDFLRAGVRELIRQALKAELSALLEAHSGDRISDGRTRRFVYIRANGVFLRPRMVEEKQCVPVFIGADAWGRKEIIGLADSCRDSSQSPSHTCKHVLPVTGRELFLDLQRRGHLHDIWQAESRVDAEAAFDVFVATYGVKYDRAVEELAKDRDVLLAFHDFPAERAQALANTSGRPTRLTETSLPSDIAAAKPKVACAAKLAVPWRSIPCFQSAKAIPVAA